MFVIYLSTSSYILIMIQSGIIHKRWDLFAAFGAPGDTGTLIRSNNSYTVYLKWLNNHQESEVSLFQIYNKNTII